MLGLNGVKAVEIGCGVESSQKKGSQNNDEMKLDSSINCANNADRDSYADSSFGAKSPLSQIRFASNHSGGILGGIANGEDIIVRVHFKPTPSIFLPQSTVKVESAKSHIESYKLELKGRHDPCIAVRGSVVCESMLAFILADMLLANTHATLKNLQKIYLG